jgi:hypothetical protein
MGMFEECICYLDAAIFNMQKKIELLESELTKNESLSQSQNAPPLNQNPVKTFGNSGSQTPISQ